MSLYLNNSKLPAVSLLLCYRLEVSAEAQLRTATKSVLSKKTVVTKKLTLELILVISLSQPSSW